MTFGRLVRRSLSHYWRVNLAVVAGVGVAVAVLSGALLVGNSVRRSLRELALGRLGTVDTVVTAPTFFRESLAAELGAAVADFEAAVPLIALNGFATDPASGRRAFGVQVYGIDERFWAFHRRLSRQVPGRDEAFLSEGLARELGIAAGAAILVRVERPTEVPLGSLHGQRDDVGRTTRLTVGATLSFADLGEFSLRQQQGPARVLFMSMSRLQESLAIGARVNTVLLAGREVEASAVPDRIAGVEAALRDTATLEDFGVTVRALPERDVLVVESATGMVSDVVAEAVRDTAAERSLEVRPILTYLVNRLRLGPREVPYSLLTAVDFPSFSALSSSARRRSGLWPEALEYPPLLLNEWAARDLGAR